MDAGTKWLVYVSIVTAAGTWGLAIATLYLAAKTRDVAHATHRTAEATLEALAQSARYQELASIAGLITDDLKRVNVKNIRASARADELMTKLGID